MLIAAAFYFTAEGPLNGVDAGPKEAGRATVNAQSASVTSAWHVGLGMDSAVRGLTQGRTDGSGLSGISGITPGQLFLIGYREFDGPGYWANHFVHEVLPCESKEWGTWYANGFVTKAQFTHRSWHIATSHTGLSDPGNPYHVGAAVAVWTNILLAEGSHPGSDAGWPSCF